MNISNAKKILDRNPNIKKLICTVYNFISFNKIQKKGKNNKIHNIGTFMKKCNITINGNNNTIYLGNMNYLIDTKIKIEGNNNEIVLGEGNYINKGDFYIEDSSNKLNIGNKTIFAGNVHLALTEGKEIVIGDKCLFSSNVVFRTGDSHSILNGEGKRINYAKDIHIGNHVWFTQNTTVLKGVRIGNDTVVATGSIVTKEIKESNVILAGNPANIIKTNINWTQERIR